MYIESVQIYLPENLNLNWQAFHIPLSVELAFTLVQQTR